MNLSDMIFKLVLNLFPIISIVYIIIGIKFYKQQLTKTINYFSLFMFASALYSLGYYLEVNSVYSQTSFFVRNFEYLGVAFVPTFAIIAISNLTKTHIFKKVRITLYITSIFIWLLYITNPLHSLFYKSIEFVVSRYGGAMITTKGPAYYLLLAYYGLFLIYSNIVLIKAYKSAVKKNRKNSYLFLLISFQIPWLTVFFILAGFDKYVDPTPFTIMFVCALFVINEIKNDMFELQITRWENIFTNIDEPAFLVDSLGNIICKNITTDTLINDANKSAEHLIIEAENAEKSNQPVFFNINEKFMWFTVKKSYFDKKNKLISYLLFDITDKKNSSLVAESFFNAIEDFIIISTQEGKILFVNNTVVERLLYTAEELKQMNVFDLHPYFKLEEATDLFEKMIKKEVNYCHLGFTTKTGKTIPVETRIWIGNWNGTPVIYAMSKDISLFKETEDKFQKSFFMNPAIMAISDLNTHKYIDVNDAFVNKIGYSKEEVIGKSAHELGLYIDESQNIAAKNILKQKGKFSDIEVDICAKNGEILTGLISGELIKSENSPQLLTVMIDITEIKKYSRRIEKEINERRVLLDNIKTQVWYLIDDYTYGAVNEAHAAFLGFKKEDLVYKDIRAIYDEKIADNFIKNNTMVFSIGKPMTIEMHVPHHSGEKRLLLINKVPKKRRDGTVEYVVCSAEDITQSRLSHERIKNSEEQLSLLISQMQQGLAVHEIICDKKGNPIDYRFLSVNSSYENLTGLNGKDIIGKTVLEVLPNTEKYWIDIYGQVALTREPYQFENYSVELNKTFSVSAYSPRQNQFAVIITDVTDKKKKEAEIEFLSYHDQLTGIYNRRFYEQHLKEIDNENHFPLTIVMIDVNGLKLTNDAFGHKTGDLLLKKVSDVLKKECRNNDVVARIGGDEFILLLPRTNEEEAKTIIDLINLGISKESIDNVIISISMGFDVKHKSSEDINEVFMKAENDMYRHKLSESSIMRSQTVNLIMNSLHEKINVEFYHSKHVGELCEEIAYHMNFSQEELSQIKIAGMMHDIGKIGIDHKILNKPDTLNSAEWSEIERHSEIGYRILKSANEYSEIANYVLEHHERWDGKGYPKGIKGNNILIQARIIAIADAYDAMISERPFREALSPDDAVSEIKKCSGSQFDPNIAKIFVEKVLEKEW